MSKQGLKPCPFCGYSGDILFSNVLTGYVAVCPECFSRTGSTESDTRASAIEVWSNRPIEDKLTAQVEMLKEAITAARENASQGYCPPTFRILDRAITQLDQMNNQEQTMNKENK